MTVYAGMIAGERLVIALPTTTELTAEQVAFAADATVVNPG
jgi:hypothetical protein